MPLPPLSSSHTVTQDIGDHSRKTVQHQDGGGMLRLHRIFPKGEETLYWVSLRFWDAPVIAAEPIIS